MCIDSDGAPGPTTLTRVRLLRSTDRGARNPALEVLRSSERIDKSGWIAQVNRWLNAARAGLGLPYWSLSKVLKQKVKRAVSYIGEFEHAVAREAKQRGMHGVVCGHIHHAELREIDGVLYANDGDWVESLTALVEHADGRLEILDWSGRVGLAAAHDAAVAAVAPAAKPRNAALDLPFPEPLSARRALGTLS